MDVTTQQTYGKKELVELLTGVKSDAFLGHIDAAMHAELRIQPEEMAKISQAVASYKANRIMCYGDSGEYTRYFSPAFVAIEEGMSTNNLVRFSEGCELLLGLIAQD